MDVMMPQLGETVAEGTVSIWHKKVGDKVTTDELLFEVSTDKVEMEVPAPAEGVVKEILVRAGETVAVGAVLAIIDEKISASADLSDKQSIPSSTISSSDFDTPSLDVNAPTSNAFKAEVRNHKRRLSPVVRKLVAEHNLNPDTIRGTGRDGRIKKSDIIFYLQKDSIELVETPSLSETAPTPDDGTKVISFNRIRRLTAEHMVRSKATSPHVHQGVEVDFSKIESARKNKGAVWKSREGFSLTYLPFVARAVCDAIVDFPNVNGHVKGDNLIIYERVNLAIAVDLDFEGLVAPVIQNVSAMTAVEIARAVTEIANRARNNELKPEDHSDATYTISNNGSFGTLFTTPIINQPQIAILSMDTIAKRPMVVEQDGEDHLVIRPIGILTQAFDHRAIDGAYSAAFLRRLKEIIERKDWEAALP